MAMNILIHRHGLQPKYATQKRHNEQKCLEPKEDFGKVPKYLKHIKNDIEAEYNYIASLQQAEEDANKPAVAQMSEEERQGLIEGLKARWEQVNTEYQAGTHITKLDTIGKIKRKEKYEAELSQIEKDIERLNRRNILVDQTC